MMLLELDQPGQQQISDDSADLTRVQESPPTCRVGSGQRRVNGKKLMDDREMKTPTCTHHTATLSLLSSRGALWCGPEFQQNLDARCWALILKELVSRLDDSEPFKQMQFDKALGRPRWVLCGRASVFLLPRQEEFGNNSIEERAKQR